MKDDELIKFANNSATVQKAKDITDFYSNLPEELDNEHKMELVKLEFYGDMMSYDPMDDLFDTY